MHFYSRLPSQRPVGFNINKTNNFSLRLPLLDGSTQMVTPVPSLRWLGVFFDPTLTFTNHVKRMAMKAKSTLAALSIVGNTVRGLSPVFMRQLYIGVVLPVLLWGAEIWCRGEGRKPQRALRNILKPVHHQGIRFTLGAYKSSPIPPMTLIAGILPLDQLLNIRVKNAQLRALTTPQRPDPIPHKRKATRSPPAYEWQRRQTPKDAETIPPLLPFPLGHRPELPHNLIVRPSPPRTPEDRAQCTQEMEIAIQRQQLIIFAAGYPQPTWPENPPTLAGAAWTAYIGSHLYTRQPLPLPATQDVTSCSLLAIQDLAKHLLSERLHLGLPQNHKDTLIVCFDQEALSLIRTPQLKSGFNLAWQTRLLLIQCATIHPDLCIRLIWGKGAGSQLSIEDTYSLAQQCSNNPDSQPLKASPTLRYLKAEAKLKAGTAWRKLLQRYYTEHPHSQATIATAQWSPHPTASYLKKLGRHRGTSALAAQTILGKGPFPTYLVGFGDEDIDPLCLCGAPESRKHLLEDCPLYLPHRAAAWRSTPPATETVWLRPSSLEALTRLISYLPNYGRSGLRKLSTGQDRPPDRWWHLLRLKNWALPWVPKPAPPTSEWLIEDFSLFQEYETYIRQYGTPDDVFNFLFNSILSV